MRLLLDTCAAIWVVEDEISQAATDALGVAEEQGEPVHVSAITAWEIALMAARNRLASPISPNLWFEQLTVRNGVRVVDLSPSILIASCFLPGPIWKDPADRMIIASAREHDFTIMTRDRLILDYARAGHVRAIAC